MNRICVNSVCFVLALLAPVLAGRCVASAEEAEFRIGIIGCDTSHVPAFVKSLATQTDGAGRKMRVVAAYPGGSDDMPASRDRVAKFTDDIRKQDVQIVDSVAALLPLVDAVLLESVDGRKHLEQARPVFAARKPMFIDKPVAASLSDVVEIFRLAEASGTPCFSSSSLRFAPQLKPFVAADPSTKPLSCDAHGPLHKQVGHPDLYWYGVHTVEMLFAVMGPGCESVSCTRTDDTELLVGVWKDGRVGTVRGSYVGPPKYGVTVFGKNGPQATAVTPGEAELTAAIAEFFRTGRPPVAASETIEIFAFMDAAEASKRQGGKPVRLAEVLPAASSER